MSLCTSELTAILGTDCIGDSRLVINANFALLSADVCTAETFIKTLSTTTSFLSSNIAGLSAKDSSTIDLTYTVSGSSSILSADVINGSIDIFKLGGNIPLTTRQFLTATSLSGIADVTVSSIQNGHVLRWNTSTGKWENGPVTAATAVVSDGSYTDIIVSGSGTVYTISPNAVNGGKLANSAVTTNKISDQNVTAIKLLSSAGNEAVITNTIRNNAVTEAKLADSAVTETKLADSSVTTNKIANATITNAKLSAATPLSIKGNFEDIVRPVVDIVATEPNGVLRRFNNALGFGSVANSATTATTEPEPNTIVLRDGSGDFICRTVISDNSAPYGLLGTALSAALASSSIQLQTPRTIQIDGVVSGSATFNGTQDITITTTGGGEINTAANVGGGIDIFKEKVGTTLNYKTLSAGRDILITDINDRITISNNLTGVPFQAQAKAWVNFNAQSGTIVSSYNVTSIQRLGAGVWYINLENNLFTNTNYCVVANTMQGNTGEGQFTFGGISGNNSGLYADIACVRPDTSSRVLYESFRTYDVRSDNVFNFVVIFG